MKNGSLIKRFVVYAFVFFAVQETLTQAVGPGGIIRSLWKDMTGARR